LKPVSVNAANERKLNSDDAANVKACFDEYTHVIRSVPSVFFSESFPGVRQVLLFEIHQQVSNSQCRIIDEVDSSLLLDQLQGNLDQVEMCLVNHVQNRTTSFFSTMITLQVILPCISTANIYIAFFQGLYVETDKMRNIVHSARKKMRLLWKKTVLPHFKLVYYGRRQERLRYLRKKLLTISDLQKFVIRHCSIFADSTSGCSVQLLSRLNSQSLVLH
jgi:hypothetical protein